MSARSPLAPYRDRREAGEEILTVAQIDARLRNAVRALGRVVVEGEVSGAKTSPNGHVYFNLKDEREEATIACVMWKGDALKSNGVDRLSDGARVQVRAVADVFAKQGRLQLQVTKVVPAGLGDLLLRREELKRKLQAEGLFDPSRKRAIPQSPRVIGVVTSATGAAFHDIVKVARRRGNVRILLSSAPVQGPDAPHMIRRALSMIAQVREVDVIIVGRGGGSAEDLAAFDDEQVARAIAACKKPVVAAVGHEVDWSIACMVADLRAATPSQAAELIVPDDANRRAQLDAATRRLQSIMHARLQQRASALARVRSRLRSPDRLLAKQRQRAEEMEQRLAAAMNARVRAASKLRESLERRLADRHPRTQLAQLRAALAPQKERLVAAMRRVLDRRRATIAAAAQKLDAISPLAVLARGYAIALVTDGEETRALRDARDVEIGNPLEIKLHRGSIEATVTRKKDEER